MRNVLLLSLVVCSLFLSGMCEEDDENDQIIGGTLAPKGQYPYMVFFRNSVTGKLFCSGTLITAYKVLTTAWCFPSSLPVLDVTAWMNTVSLTPDVDRVVRRVIRVVRAPDYNPVTGLHDIAIVTLDAPVFSVRPVPLAFGAYVNAGNTAVITGWGYTGPSQLSTLLRHSPITIQPKSLCMASFSNSNFGSAYFICAASVGVGSCSLDAGSPILLNGNQLGISSQSRCGGGEPIVGVDVRAYQPWIVKNL
ncbi:chymotrypsin-2-like [Daphnia carinata]|uniref:chymotrypsin-2-like n=1 Tax=Daphnia carinata TaxID=120202 RepID=UPI00257F5FB2|nr:chymotrypsin-2-like [Daphnia carinata]